MSETKTTSAKTATPEAAQKTRPILEVQGLTKYFDAAKGKKVHAVENVSFTLERGETLGIVGESGCGKSSMGRTILKIHDSTSGKIIFDGVDITKFSNKQMNPYRKRMQMIFQDPYASLNPRMTVGEIIEEPMVIHNMGTPKERKAIVQDLIQTVGLKRRSASANRNCKSPGPQPGVHCLRRTDFCPGRFNPGSGNQPAGKASARKRIFLPLHCARPGNGASHQSQDWSYVSGKYGGVRNQ